jgi:purine-nucleoside phosphorylase
MAPTAPQALLCGDPARALAIAQVVLAQPRMSNHHRGLWGYHGTTAAGLELTVQSTGIGGPSAAIVVDELAALGLRRAIRVGTAAGAGAEPPLGAILVAEHALGREGTSAALGLTPGDAVPADTEITEALARAAGAPRCTVVSRDLRLGHGAEAEEIDRAEVADLQSAGLLAAAAAAGVRCGVGLVVGSAAGRRLEDEPLESRLLQLARAAAAALVSLYLSSR